jgi:hypothetical protein
VARARAAELLRPLGAFLLVVAAGVALVLIYSGRPSADAASATAAGPGGAAPQLAPLPADAPVAHGPITPTRLQIPDIGVDTTVEPHGTVQYDNPFTGQKVDGYGVPKSMWTAAWWSDGPQPGSGSMAVVLGHAQAAHGAVFDHLADLRPGNEVDLVDASGAVLHLKVLENPVTGLDKSTSALADTLNGHPADADLALVTCGGDFDRAAGASEDNEVVFASVV